MRLQVPLTLLATLAAAAQLGSSLTPSETCDLCQRALRTVYGFFQARIPSRRKLLNQLRHECKRHPNYRRRCLLLVKSNLWMLYNEMTNSPFKSLQTCLVLKECKSVEAAAALLPSLSSSPPSLPSLPDDYSLPDAVATAAIVELLAGNVSWPTGVGGWPTF